MKTSLPIIEIREIYKGLTVANSKGFATSIMENIHIKFELDRIWGSVIRNTCTQQFIVDFELEDESPLHGVELLLPWAQMNKLFSLGIDNAELYLDISGNTLEFIDGRTSVTIIMDSPQDYPKIKVPDGEILWTLPAATLKELIACRTMCIDSDFMPDCNRVLLANKGGMLRSFVFVDKSMICTSLAPNGSRLCEGKGLEALNFKLSTND